MKLKYHNSPNGPRICRATVQECQYSSAGGSHYETFEEAQAKYEMEQVKKYGSLLKVSKSDKLVQEAHRAFYTASDRGIKKINKTNNRLKARIRLAKASPEIQQAKADMTMLMKDVQKLALNTEAKANQFKNRMKGYHLYSKMRAKRIVNLSTEKYRKLEKGYINFIDNADNKMTSSVLNAVGKAERKVNRMKNAFGEAGNRIKAASEAQKQVVKILRENSPQRQAQLSSGRLIETTKLDKSTINPQVSENYFKALDAARSGRRKADTVEDLNNIRTGHGKRRRENIEHSVKV